MNDFIVTYNGKKRSVKIHQDTLVNIDGEEKEVEFSKVNDYSYLLKIDNKTYSITTTKLNGEEYGFLVDGHYFETAVRTSLQEKVNEFLLKKQKQSHHDSINAPMPGSILKIKKSEGDKVEIGESVAVLEAMKMENDLRSPASGIIKNVLVEEGDSVEKNAQIMIIE